MRGYKFTLTPCFREDKCTISLKWQYHENDQEVIGINISYSEYHFKYKSRQRHIEQDQYDSNKS